MKDVLVVIGGRVNRPGDCSTSKCRQAHFVRRFWSWKCRRSGNSHVRCRCWGVIRHRTKIMTGDIFHQSIMKNNGVSGVSAKINQESPHLTAYTRSSAASGPFVRTGHAIVLFRSARWIALRIHCKANGRHSALPIISFFTPISYYKKIFLIIKTMAENTLQVQIIQHWCSKKERD